MQLPRVLAIAVATLLGLLIIACASDAVAASKYAVKQDPEAVAVATAAFAAMGGVEAVAGYQDSLASGTVTIYAAGDPVSYPITMKSKGLRETRVELQMPKGTNIRIVNQGQAEIVRPDGSVRTLDSNNTFYEHVNHIPLLSLLAEYANGTVNLLYNGLEKIKDQSEDVIEVDFVPTDDPATGEMFASRSRTLFFVNQLTHVVDKIQTFPLYEGDMKDTLTEEVYLTDYKQISGIAVPFRQTIFTNGTLDSDIVLNSATFNVGLTDDQFVLPARDAHAQ